MLGNFDDDEVFVQIFVTMAQLTAELAGVMGLRKRITPIRNQDYFQNVIFNYPDESFGEHFRMSRHTFEVLRTTVFETWKPEEHSNISIEKQLLITIWILAISESFRRVADRFDISNGTAHYIFVKAIKIVSNLSTIYIKWPNRNDIASTKEYYSRNEGFPGIVGFIDATYIKIKAPKANVAYINRKKDASLILQYACNEKQFFLDIYFGEVGSLHDSRVFGRSPSFSSTERKAEEMVGSDGHLLADAAYPLLKYILISYKNNGHLVNEQINFNYVHSNIRVKIEQAFDRLKGKWRRLKYFDATVFEYLRDAVVSCCVLHNVIIKNKDIYGHLHDYDLNELKRNEVNHVIEELTEANRRDDIALTLYYRNV